MPASPRLGSCQSPGPGCSSASPALRRLRLMPGMLSAHLPVACGNEPCERHQSLPVLSKTKRRRSCRHRPLVQQLHGREEPPCRQSSRGFPLSAEQGAQWLYLPRQRNLPSGQHEPAQERRVWAREARGSGAEHEQLAQEAAGLEAAFPTGGRWGSICMPLLCLPAPVARYACLSGNCPRAL